MKTVEKWRWRIRWAGRWTTSGPWTEDQVRREHPEAERVPGTRILVQLPESDAEVAACQRPANRGAARAGGEP